MRAYLWASVAALIVLLFTSQKHAGFTIFFVLPVLAGWLIYNLARIRKQPERWKGLAIKTAIWLVALAIALLCQWNLARLARQDADLLVSRVLSYKAQHGVYPKDMLEAGITDPEFGRRWKLGYLIQDGRPFILYASTFVVFDAYIYDFDANQWVYKAD